MSDYISKSAVMKALCGGHYRHDDLVEIIEHFPTLDETEIIRKPFKRVVERLETIKDEYDHSCLDNAYQRGAGDGVKWLKKKAIEIVKEECGINE